MFPLLPLLALSGLAAAHSVLFVTDADNVERAAGALPSCIADSYYGSYAHPLRSVFLLSSECFEFSEEALTAILLNGHLDVLEFDAEFQDLVWVQRDQVEPSVMEFNAQEAQGSFSDQIQELLEAQKNTWASFGGEGVQYVMPSADDDSSVPSPALHYLSSDAALISLPRSLSTVRLPPYSSMYVLSPVPLLTASPTSPRVSAVLSKGITFDPEIASILSTLSSSRILSNVRHLSGEDGLGILSRHSFSKGALDAAEWIKEQFEAAGAECEFWPFAQGYAPNVLCHYTPTTNSTDRIILSAHYDSRGSFGSTRAPGADDDGSGTAHILNIAHAIHERGIKFERPVELVAFAGEEQGLVGSRYYAQHLKSINASIALMIQADMLAYHDPREPPQLALPATIGSLDARALLSNMSKIYAPELTVGYTFACCSDHQSFHQLGYTATQVFERAGPIADPMYHNSGDLSNRTGYDVDQIKSIAKATFASLLAVAGYEIADE